jgi:hypothetical protein
MTSGRGVLLTIGVVVVAAVVAVFVSRQVRGAGTLLAASIREEAAREGASVRTVDVRAWSASELADGASEEVDLRIGADRLWLAPGVATVTTCGIESPGGVAVQVTRGGTPVPVVVQAEDPATRHRVASGPHTVLFFLESSTPRARYSFEVPDSGCVVSLDGVAPEKGNSLGVIVVVKSARFSYITYFQCGPPGDLNPRESLSEPSEMTVPVLRVPMRRIFGSDDRAARAIDNARETLRRLSQQDLFLRMLQADVDDLAKVKAPQAALETAMLLHARTCCMSPKGEAYVVNNVPDGEVLYVVPSLTHHYMAYVFGACGDITRAGFLSNAEGLDADAVLIILSRLLR